MLLIAIHPKKPLLILIYDGRWVRMNWQCWRPVVLLMEFASTSRCRTDTGHVNGIRVGRRRSAVTATISTRYSSDWFSSIDDNIAFHHTNFANFLQLLNQSLTRFSWAVSLTWNQWLRRNVVMALLWLPAWRQRTPTGLTRPTVVLSFSNNICFKFHVLPCGPCRGEEACVWTPELYRWKATPGTSNHTGQV